MLKFEVGLVLGWGPRSFWRFNHIDFSFHLHAVFALESTIPDGQWLSAGFDYLRLKPTQSKLKLGLWLSSAKKKVRGHMLCWNLMIFLDLEKIRKYILLEHCQTLNADIEKDLYYIIYIIILYYLFGHNWGLFFCTFWTLQS